MFDRSRTRFHDKNWQKSSAVSKVFDRVKTVALWSAKNIYIYIYIEKGP